MSRRPARVTQADIARAIRAVQQEGDTKAVKIDPNGTIWIVPLPQKALDFFSDTAEDGEPLIF